MADHHQRRLHLNHFETIVSLPINISHRLQSLELVEEEIAVSTKQTLARRLEHNQHELVRSELAGTVQQHSKQRKTNLCP